jgi:hypothetical protein
VQRVIKPLQNYHVDGTSNWKLHIVWQDSFLLLFIPRCKASACADFCADFVRRDHAIHFFYENVLKFSVVMYAGIESECPVTSSKIIALFESSLHPPKIM